MKELWALMQETRAFMRAHQQEPSTRTPVRRTVGFYDVSTPQKESAGGIAYMSPQSSSSWGQAQVGSVKGIVKVELPKAKLGHYKRCTERRC